MNTVQVKLNATHSTADMLCKRTARQSSTSSWVTDLGPSDSGVANEGGLVIGSPPVAPPVLAIYIGWLYSHCSQLEDSMLCSMELEGVSQRKKPHTYSCPSCNRSSEVRFNVLSITQHHACVIAASVLGHGLAGLHPKPPCIFNQSCTINCETTMYLQPGFADQGMTMKHCAAASFSSSKGSATE